MPKLIMLVILAVTVCACGGEQGKANASEAESGSKAKKRSPKWEIRVDGRPDVSGRVITAVTAGGFGNYSMADSDTTISVKLDEKNPGSSISIKYKEDGVRCMNFGDARVVADGDKARISGEVGCYGPDQKSGDHQKAAIDGWFEINK